MAGFLSRRFVGLVLAVGVALFSRGESAAQDPARTSAIKDGDRIVFVGDSITGQGAKGGKSAWIALIGEGLSFVRPDAKPTLIGLGGSGSTVGAWLNHEKNSRTKPVALDVKEIDVGQTLDAGAEIIVVMLGMNDVLAPAVKGDAESFDAWIGRYAELIDALRARSHPRVIAVATITPCTEDPNSPKNRALAEMNARLRKFAAEKGLIVLPTGEASWEVQALGRMGEPEFQITGDYVHPRAPGHLAIAVGMLRGLGEETAAARLLAQYESLYHREPERQAAVAYTFQRLAGSPDDATQRFIVDYRWPGTPPAVPEVTARLPAGWKATPASLRAAKGRFEISGPLDRLENPIILAATAGNETREQRIIIPAGWRVAVGRGKNDGWTRNTDYDPAKDHQPLDESLAKGASFSAPVAFPVGEPAPWQLYVASKDFTGLNNRTGSVDFAAIAFFSYGQQAYGARWIYSERERPVRVDVSTQTFAGMFSLGVWLNGQSVFAGKVKKETVASSLHRGWNLLLFRSDFIQWQWQFAIELAGHDGDDLADLRYATKPPAAPAP